MLLFIEVFVAVLLLYTGSLVTTGKGDLTRNVLPMQPFDLLS